MQLHISDQQNDLSIDLTRVESIVRHVLKSLNRSCDEVGIYFVSTAEISRLHLLYFDDASITDCISFPVEQIGDYQVLGEVFVCPYVAIDYTQKYPELSLTPHEETTLYLVHGLLHLLGFDDLKENERKLMHATQDQILCELKREDLCLRPV